MRALILAAGDGSRLGNEASGEPKALFKIDGVPLIERAISQLKVAGIREIVVVTGYQGHVLENWIKAEIGPLNVPIKILYNSKWDIYENGYSAYVAQSVFDKEEKFVLVMVDHIFEDGLIQKLMNTDLGKCNIGVGTDFCASKFIDPEEATKIKLENKKIVRIGKDVNPYDGLDVGAFVVNGKFFKFLQDGYERNKTSFSDGVNIAANRGSAIAIDVTGYWWVDIDEPSDVSRFALISGCD